MKKNQKGVTLISLTVTISVLLILASIGAYTGIKTLNNAKLTQFTAEMKLMQLEVNELYERWKKGEKITIDGNETAINEIGQKAVETDQAYIIDKSEILNRYETTEEKDKIKQGFRIYNKSIIEQLGIEGIEKEFIINVEKRMIISKEGLKYNGILYYTLEQLPDGLYNVEYVQDTSKKPTFEVTTNVKEKNRKWEIKISNIEFEGNIKKWDVYYRLKNDSQKKWKINNDNLTLEVNEPGTYEIMLGNNEIKSEIKEITTEVEITFNMKDIDGNFMATKDIKLNIYDDELCEKLLYKVNLKNGNDIYSNYFDNKTYYVKMEEAPIGYNKPEEVFSFEVKGEKQIICEIKAEKIAGITVDGGDQYLNENNKIVPEGDIGKTNNKGNITIKFQAEEGWQGKKVNIYKIADIEEYSDTIRFELDSRLSNTGLDLYKNYNKDEYISIRNTVTNALKSQTEITSIEMTVNSNNEVKFQNLQQGIYFIIYEENGIYKINPEFITIPSWNEENPKPIYDMNMRVLSYK